MRKDRSTVVIYKHLGTLSAPLIYPQCELIVDEGKTKFFEPDMTLFLHLIFLNMAKTISWSISSLPIPNELIARQNIYSLVDYFGLLYRSATDQILDNYGKMRALIFTTTFGPMTMAFPPSQPENLPVALQGVSTDLDWALQVFPYQPMGMTTVLEGGVTKITGLWFQVMDIPFGVYVPVHPSERVPNLPLGPPNPIDSFGVNVVTRLQKLRRDLDIILQLVRWLFIVAQMTAPLAPDAFYRRYFVVTRDRDPDSARYYDFSRLTRKLPFVNSVEEGIRLMEMVAPSLFQKGKFQMYSEKFGTRISEALREYYKLYSPLPLKEPIEGIDEEWIVPIEIKNLFTSAEDFRQQTSVLIFISEKDIEAWKLSIKRPSYYNIIIHKELHLNLRLLDEPYLYSGLDGKIYLMQNIHLGIYEGVDPLARAINVATTWAEHRINIGPAGEPYLGEIPPYVIYIISTASTPVVIEDNSENDQAYLQILLYKEGPKLTSQYAAMLPLL